MRKYYPRDGKAIRSKKTLRGITMGRGPLWGINSLSFILALLFREKATSNTLHVPKFDLTQYVHSFYSLSVWLPDVKLDRGWKEVTPSARAYCSSWVPSATKWSMHFAEASPLQQKPTSLSPSSWAHQLPSHRKWPRCWTRPQSIIVVGDPFKLFKEAYEPLVEKQSKVTNL